MSVLYDEYIKRLLEVNDETKTAEEHERLRIEFMGWKQGIFSATAQFFNGDVYYLERGVDRPMCCGEFLDWEHKG